MCFQTCCGRARACVEKNTHTHTHHTNACCTSSSVPAVVCQYHTIAMRQTAPKTQCALACPHTQSNTRRVTRYGPTPFFVHCYSQHTHTHTRGLMAGKFGNCNVRMCRCAGGCRRFSRKESINKLNTAWHASGAKRNHISGAAAALPQTFSHTHDALNKIPYA